MIIDSLSQTDQPVIGDEQSGSVEDKPIQLCLCSAKLFR